MRRAVKQNKLNRVPYVKQLFKARSKPLLLFGSSGFLTITQQVVEGFIYLRLRLKIKKNIRKKKKQSRAKNAKFSYWARYNPNTFFTKKSKNARMGSGNGKFVRRAFTVPANSSLLEFRGFRIP